MRYTDADIRSAMRREMEEDGSLRKFATRIGVSGTLVSQVLNRDLPPGPKIATALGYAEDGKRWIKNDNNSINKEKSAVVVKPKTIGSAQ